MSSARDDSSAERHAQFTSLASGLLRRWLNAGTKIGLAKSLLHYYSKYYIAAGKHHDTEYAEQRCAPSDPCFTRSFAEIGSNYS